MLVRQALTVIRARSQNHPALLEIRQCVDERVATPYAHMLQVNWMPVCHVSAALPGGNEEFSHPSLPFANLGVSCFGAGTARSRASLPSACSDWALHSQRVFKENVLALLVLIPAQKALNFSQLK